MITLLARIFLKEKRSDLALPAVRQKYGILAGCLGIVLNVLLFGFKYLAGVLTASIAITVDAFNNLSDAGSSVISLFGFKISARSADSEHPFGHGLAENVAGLIIAVLIMLMGIDLAKTSVQKIISPEPVAFHVLSAVILGLSVLVKLYIAFYNRNLGAKIDSATMRATFFDSISDACATFAVLLSSIFTKFTGINIDGWTGAVISLLILKAGLSAAKETISPLLGRAPSKEFLQKIEALVMEDPLIVGVHDMIVHEYGVGNRMVSLHAEVPANGDILEMHDHIDTMERKLQTELNCHAVIHMDPVVTDDESLNETKLLVLQAVQKVLDESVTIHDFRMVPGPTHTNVIFDAVLPLTAPVSDQDAAAKIREAVRTLDGNYFAVVTIDRAYS